MLGILAAIVFAVAFIFHGAGFHSSAWFDPTSLALLGLFFLTLHLLGVGTAITLRRS